MIDRLNQLIKRERLTSVKFAEILSVQPSTVSHILSGRNKPSYDFIIKLVDRFPELDTDWLLKGTGDMYKSNLPDVTNGNILEVTNVKRQDVFDSHVAIKQLRDNIIGDNFDSAAVKKSASPQENITAIKEPHILKPFMPNANEDAIVFSSSQYIDTVSSDPAPRVDSQNIISAKAIAKIVIFYSDGTFELFQN